MRLSGKTKGYFVEANEYSTLVARTSSMSTPLVVEQVEVLAEQGLSGLGPAFDKVAGARRAGTYRNAVCSISPERRFIRRASLDAKRGKETAYLEEVLATQFRAEPDKMVFAILGSADGGLLAPDSPGGTEVVFCGGYAEDFAQAQQTLLGSGIFPERLELSSVAMLGGMQGVLGQQDNKAPTLVLEIGREATHCYIVNSAGVDLARPIPHGINSMIPIAQKELGLRDEEAAAKLLFSNTFDFAGMGPNLVKRLLKELQSSIGFFEVQTGQSIGQLYCSVQPSGFNWLSSTLASALGVGQLTLDLKPWLAKQGIKFAPGVCPEAVPGTWFGLLSLMANNQPLPASHEAQ
jgi:hypothetical protein